MPDPAGGFDHLLSQTAVVMIRTEVVITKEARTIWPGPDAGEAESASPPAALSNARVAQLVAALPEAAY